MIRSFYYLILFVALQTAGYAETGIIITILDGNSSESATDNTATFNVRLMSPPAYDVDIALTSNDTTEGVVNKPLSLKFTQADWDTDQLVTVTGVNDREIDGDIWYRIDLNATSLDSQYDGKSESVNLMNSDDDPLILEGLELETVITESGVEPAILVTENITLPNEPILFWSCIFNGDLNHVTISASFNDAPLVILNSHILQNNVIETIEIAIDDYEGENGVLEIKLESNGTALPANLFLIRSATDPALGALPAIYYILQ